MTALELLTLLPLLTNSARSTISLIARLKPEIQALFSKGEITAEQQAALMAEVDDILAAHEAGELPPHWRVQSHGAEADS